MLLTCRSKIAIWDQKKRYHLTSCGQNQKIYENYAPLSDCVLSRDGWSYVCVIYYYAFGCPVSQIKWGCSHVTCQQRTAAIICTLILKPAGSLTEMLCGEWHVDQGGGASVSDSPEVVMTHRQKHPVYCKAAWATGRQVKDRNQMKTAERLSS